MKPWVEEIVIGLAAGLVLSAALTALLLLLAHLV